MGAYFAWLSTPLSTVASLVALPTMARSLVDVFARRDPKVSTRTRGAVQSMLDYAVRVEIWGRH
jgi:hypothetical protein